MTQKESLPTRLLKYKIIEPNPNEKGEYRYTDNFHNFWTEDRKTYEGFEVDYIFDNQEQIRQDFIRSMLFGYSEKYVLVPREKRYPITDGPDVDDEIVEDLASSLSFTDRYRQSTSLRINFCLVKLK